MNEPNFSLGTHCVFSDEPQIFLQEENGVEKKIENKMGEL